MDKKNTLRILSLIIQAFFLLNQKTLFATLKPPKATKVQYVKNGKTINISCNLIFIGEEHKDKNHDKAFLQLLRKMETKPTKIFMERLYEKNEGIKKFPYLKEKNYPYSMSRADIKNYLKDRKFNWYPEKSDNTYEILQYCSKNKIEVVGIDREKFNKSPFTRISKSIHVAWANTIFSNTKDLKSNKEEFAIIYAGHAHLKLFRLYKVIANLSGYFFDLKTNSYKAQ